MTLLVTGGSGFIGSNFIIERLKNSSENIINLDKLTYAAKLNNLSKIKDLKTYKFVKGDIGDKELIDTILKEENPRAIINFAAETHVDRSIVNPEEFLQTNIIGTFRLLNSSKKYWGTLNEEKKLGFRFLHVSTDEVFGSLDQNEPPFDETNPYKPNSPYSASKAASDHLARSYFHTYKMPILITNCSNNYGPYQLPEKLIPMIILKSLALKKIPIYGDGKNVRDWLFVNDHCNAINVVLDKGIPGDVYCIGGLNEKKNIEIANIICDILDELLPIKNQNISSYRDLINYVSDRPGHDKRYAIDPSKIINNLNWEPKETFESGIRKTVKWYLNNQQWMQDFIDINYYQ